MIHDSTEYIKPDQSLGILKLEVNSQWDFSSRCVCYKQLSTGHWIPYNLRECIEVISNTQTRWKDAEITDKVKKELVDKGYTIKEVKE